MKLEIMGETKDISHQLGVFPSFWGDLNLVSNPMSGCTLAFLLQFQETEIFLLACAGSCPYSFIQ